MLDSAVLAIIIMAMTGVLFLIRKIPMAISAMVGVLLMMLVGILTPQQVCDSFGNYICILLACSSIVSEAAFETGLTDWLGDWICSRKRVIASEKRTFLCMIAMVAVMSMFVANIPVVALFIPIASAAAVRSKGKISRKMLIMAIGFAATMGGCGTLIGASTNMAANASLQATTGDSLGMFTLMPATLILCAVMILYFSTIGYRLEKRLFKNDLSKQEAIQTHQSRPLEKKKVILVTIVFVGMIVGFLSGIWNFGIVAMIAAVTLILTRTVSLENALKKADWNTTIVVGAALSLAAGMNQSGAGVKVANAILSIIGTGSQSPYMLLGFTVVLASVLSCVMQNNAVVAILIPIFCTVAAKLGVNAIPFAVAIICGCNICYATPISTAPVTMTLTAGYQFSDYIKIGGPLMIISDLVAVFTIPLLYPL